jgi:hypothetical protein
MGKNGEKQVERKKRFREASSGKQLRGTSRVERVWEMLYIRVIWNEYYDAAFLRSVCFQWCNMLCQGQHGGVYPERF